jgi:hypothetical protein
MGFISGHEVLNLLQDVNLMCRQQISICVSVDDEFQFALSFMDPSKELETYFVISNLLAKLKLLIPLQQFLPGIKKVYITVRYCTLLYITISVVSFSLSLITLYHKLHQP